MNFADLGLSPELLKAVEDAGYSTPTPIQAQAIPHVLAGRDVLGLAQTGTGKTASFTLPMIDILAQGRARARMPRTLILEPTRELAAQVSESFEKYGKHSRLTQALIIGGVSFADQERKLERGVDVLIATPGRLIDQFERAKLMLNGVQILVIDEADRMLDMGFIPDIERIVKMLPFTRQTLFFSATMPPEITRLVEQFLHNPVRVEVSRPATAATTIEQKLTVVPEIDKREALRRLIRENPVQNAIIFCNRKRDVDIVGKSLKKHGFNAAPIHGDLDQPTRMKTLESFKSGELQLLVASDVAARGLDIPLVSHVFNFDVPIHSDDYVHRIGRTGRAGRSGVAITIATPHDQKFVDAIEKLTGKPIERFEMTGLEEARKPQDAEERGDRRRDLRDKNARRRKDRFERKPPDHGHVASLDPYRAPEGEEAAAAPPPAAPPRPERPEREPRGERRGRADHRADHRAHHRANGRDDRPRAEEPAARADEPRRDRRESREERARRYRDDLGPRFVGFGDHTPAFMTIAVPRIWERPTRSAPAPAAVQDETLAAPSDVETPVEIEVAAAPGEAPAPQGPVEADASDGQEAA